MSEEEISDILDELNNVRPEVLNDNAKRLFNAIMQIADERDEYINLYNKEKNKSKEYEETLIKKIKYCNELEKDLFENCSKYVVSKDKIREKIEEVKSLENVSIADMLESEKEFCIDILKELL